MGLSLSAFQNPDRHLLAFRQLLRGRGIPQLDPVDQDDPAPEILTRLAPPLITPGGVQAIDPHPTFGPTSGGFDTGRIQPVQPQPTLGRRPALGGTPLDSGRTVQPVRPHPTFGAPQGRLGPPLFAEPVGGETLVDPGETVARIGQLLGLHGRPKTAQPRGTAVGITRGPANPSGQGRPRGGGGRRAPFRRTGAATQRFGRPSFVEDRTDLDQDRDPRTLRTVPRQSIRSRLSSLLRSR